MFRPRIIPVLLLKNNVLVKTIAFGKHQYIGDPINAVKIFNDFKADEIAFLDIEATSQKRNISTEFIREIGEEANMPFSVGGGIRTIESIRNATQAGAEKVIIGTYAVENPDFIKDASETFGSSTICVCIDVKKTIFGKEKVCFENGKNISKYSPLEFALLMEEKGAGEIIIQSINNDGKMTGYNVELMKIISENCSIPVIALGGAGNLSHLKEMYLKTNVTGLACGSLFVFHGKNKGVLINYPEKGEISFNKS